MTEEVIVVIALVVAAIVARINYVQKVSGGKTKKQKLVDKAKAAGTVTVGHCVDSRLNFGDRGNSDADLANDSVVVKYIYTVNGRDYYKTMQYRNNGSLRKDHPINVYIYYDAGNPKKAVCQEEVTAMANVRSGCLTTIGTFIVTLFCVFHLLRFLFL